ncbi:MarR family transcriptional regulator [Streptomyces sp. NPDC047928]|uniref:MarR family transcriptional regulator n=1 Tax=unclassified Streptomyces TaxID=2593676 RepID=UPI00371530C6
MSDIRESMQRAGLGVLHLALAQCRVAGSTMALRVRGRPGGTFHLRRGGVVAVESPGAPGVETLLLRSGRIREADWARLPPPAPAPAPAPSRVSDAASGAAAGPAPGTDPPGAPDAAPGAARAAAPAVVSGRSCAELVARGLVGAAELQVISAMALQDAVFAVVAGDMEDCVAEQEQGPLVPVAPGEDPLRLLDVAARRLGALAALPHAVLPDRERVVAGRGVEGAAVEALAPHRREILFLANGRRTARDIAFVIGRGVYHVTVEMSRMLGEGLLERTAYGTDTGVPKVWADREPVPRGRLPAPGVAAAGGAVHGPDRTGEHGTGLPRRVPGASGFLAFTAKVLDTETSVTSGKGLLRTGSRTRGIRIRGADS